MLSRNGVLFSGFFQYPWVNHQPRVVERTRPIMVLTVYTGDPKHKVFPVQVSSSATSSSSLQKDRSDRVVARQSANASRGTSGMGKGHSGPSSGWRASQRGTLTSSRRFAFLIIIFQDRTRDNNGDVTGKLPFRLHNCPNTGWELPSCSRAAVDEHKPASYGMQRPERINTSETWVNLQIHAPHGLS